MMADYAATGLPPAYLPTEKDDYGASIRVRTRDNQAENLR
jgi:hypothetical protein